jgi:hypothetical protein
VTSKSSAVEQTKKQRIEDMLGLPKEEMSDLADRAMNEATGRVGQSIERRSG